VDAILAVGVVDPSATSATGLVKREGRERESLVDPRESEREISRIIVHSCKFLCLTRFGHFARECREEEDRCYKCHGTGHIARNCSQEEDTCYNCNQIGHIVKDCPNAGTKTCYKCGGVGHILRECPSK